jgi:hypothetical protein
VFENRVLGRIFGPKREEEDRHETIRVSLFKEGQMDCI